ncbi:MAG: hypothetical protein ACT4PT_10835 [Methanobacteriota archaeon]
MVALGYVVNLVGALLVVALGAFVASVNPRIRANAAFAAFAVLFGLAFALSNVPFFLPLGHPAAPLATGSAAALNVGWLAAASWFFLVFPRGLRGSGPGVLLVPAAIVAVMVALSVSVLRAGLFTAEWYYASERLGPRAANYFFLTALPAMGVLWAGVALAALRASPSRNPGAEERRKLALVSVGVGGVMAFSWGLAIHPDPAPPAPAAVLVTLGVATLVLPFIPPTLWIRNTRGPDSRLARNVALVLLSATLAGMIVRAVLGSEEAVDASGTYGLARTSMVAVLAYAILRHQLFDIDVKLKFTIRQSTVAAVFIGIFFVVSESAQAFLSDRTGTYLGIVAAGALVFAIAPLQRIAERVADRAMPGVKSVPDMSEEERAAFYREQLEVAYLDGVVDPGERLLLQSARRRLALPAEVAERLEAEVAARRAGA